MDIHIVEHGTKHGSRPWWEYMNDPTHPSRRTRRHAPTRSTDDRLSCGLGGCTGLYWFWIICPGVYDKKPHTPAFYN